MDTLIPCSRESLLRLGTERDAFLATAAVQGDKLARIANIIEEACSAPLLVPVYARNGADAIEAIDVIRQILLEG